MMISQTRKVFKESIFSKDYSSIILLLLFLYLGMAYFSVAIANILLVPIGITFLLGLGTKKLSLNLSLQRWILYSLIIVPFILTLISGVFSENIEKAIRHISLRATIPALAFIIIFLEFKKKALINGFKLFVCASIIASILTLTNVVKYFNDNILFDGDLAFFITTIHHPYFAVYLLLALVILVECKLIEHKLFRGIIGFILLTTIIVSTSRLVYLLLLLWVFINVFRRYLKKYYKPLLIVFGLVSLFSLANQSIRDTVIGSLSHQDAPRLRMWSNGIKVVESSDKQLFGIGIGDYYQKKYDPYYLKESDSGYLGYNPDSQLIEFYITNGLFGVIIIILTFAILFKKVLSTRMLNVFIFIVIVSFSITETILSRQYGVQLYSVLFPLLFKDVMKEV